jgi:threonine dehydrogenase-like Zn-dependent dehydrogenase
MAAVSRDVDRTVRALVIEQPYQAVVRELPDAALTDGWFRVDTMYSGVSIGTELTWYRGTSPLAQRRWDRQLGMFITGEDVNPYPVTNLGYMSVGRVVAARTRAVAEGETVAMTYGHRSGHTANPMVERFVPLPDRLDPLLGIFVAHMGPICANGLLAAAVDTVGHDVRALSDGIAGRVVVVVGAGVVGLLTGLFAQAHGAAEVVVVDQAKERLAAAASLGFVPLGPDDSDPALTVKQQYAHGVGDRGADVVFQCRGNDAALATALRCARPQGVVVDLAFYPGGAEAVRLGEEFHHNQLTLRCAQIGRVPRGLADRWDRERLSRETIDLLSVYGAAVREHLITDLVPLDDAPALFADVSARRRTIVGAVLCPDPRSITTTT